MSAVGDVASDLVAGPKLAISKPLMFVGIGLFFLLLIVTIEVFKPGLVTDPIRKFLGMVGVKGKA